jgi:DeoR family glycerol-3-phosphate regulon repressor
LLTGGTLRRADGGLVGPQAVEGIERFRADIAVLSCSALDETGDLLDYDRDEVAVTRAVIRHARQRFLLADHSKFQRHAPARVGSLSQMTAVFTDAPLPAAAQSTCRRGDVEAVVTAP